MAEYDATRVAAIILREFSRSGSRGLHTMPFADLPNDVRSLLADELQCGEDELPILAHYLSEYDWSVLTTQRLVTRRSSILASTAWTRFSDFRVNLNAVASLLDPKDSLDTLTVETTDGETVTISADAGAPFLAFWNSLILAKRMAAEEERRRNASSR